ncbi:hypothetical protein K8354_15800 [Polaribacter litorisediminis]|uniref:hypothetical protein n=1 Tax=Polaribacter litorisediminis TaxID=1908341 RepID=UPI001CC100A5|nr:hypothetical protein [Polaribacter litorisediminis]UAM97741.1 hypothetical protein K8354_15800 [Polaribacter litorisediminis]
MTAQLTVLTVIFLGAIIFFLLIREIVCWYYKINIRIELQKETNSLLRRLVEKNESKVSEKNNSDSSETTFYGDKDELKKALGELRGQ